MVALNAYAVALVDERNPGKNPPQRRRAFEDSGVDISKIYS